MLGERGVTRSVVLLVSALYSRVASACVMAVMDAFAGVTDGQERGWVARANVHTENR